MEFVFNVISDKGNVKKINQDNHYMKFYEDEVRKAALFLICDGMGGLKQGEIASLTVVKNFEKYFDPKVTNLLYKDKKSVFKFMNNILLQANKQLIQYSKKENIQIGTTASALFIIDNYYFIAHVGDSRIYVIRDEEIKQLTEDHTYVAQCVREGKMTEEEAKISNQKHILTQCIGVLDEVKVYNRFGRIDENTSFLLCSDGLYNTISELELMIAIHDADLTTKDKISECAEFLVNKAMSNKERDNITCEIVHVQDNMNKGIFKGLKNVFSKKNTKNRHVADTQDLTEI